MVTINTVIIARIGSHKTVKFAAEELAKYLRKMEQNAVVDVRIYDDYDENLKDVLWVGMSEKFDEKIPEVKDKKLDDAIVIDVENYKGIITGANERAVLIAAYRFLREIGVVFVRPGEGEEIVPKKALDTCDVKVCEAPSYRHRGVCIEGSTSYQHVYNIIDWLPKAGMNGYEVQFFMPYTFLNRWYIHQLNGNIESKQITYDDVEHMLRKIEEDLGDRSLLYHTPGHGWTSDPFGVVGSEWSKYEGELPEKYKEVLALVDGKRELQGGIPLNTNLCYSDPYVIETICEFAVDLCKKKPSMTHLILTLADGSNSHCECEKCINEMPSDLYINLLNKVDEAFTKAGIDTKIVFALYVDTLWAPVKNTFNNPDRFVLLLAPITRSYSDSYLDLDYDNLEPHPEFVRNKTPHPESVSQFVSLLRTWQNKVRYDDSYIFEYHVWTRPNYDLGRIGLAELLHKDIRALELLGLNGYMSCQTQRNSFPNNFLMETMAQTLWDKNISFEDIEEKYMKGCYGKNYKKAMEYLENLSRLVCPGPYIGSEALKNLPAEERKEMSEKALELAVSFRAEINRILEENDFEYEAQKKSWEYLVYNTEIAERVAKIYVNRFSGKTIEETQPLLDNLAFYFCTIEPEVHNALDVWRTKPTKGYPYFFGDATSNF